MQLKQQDLNYVEHRKPEVNDFLRGWDDAEKGVAYTRTESDDWRMGWSLWHHEHGAKRSTSSCH